MPVVRPVSRVKRSTVTALFLVVGLTGTMLWCVAPAGAVTKAALRAKLLTATEFAPISTREGWRVVDNQPSFDCGAVQATKPAALSVRRSYSSAEDASGFEFLARYGSKARAKTAFADAKAAVRHCTVESGFLRIKADEPVAAPGQLRLIDVFTGHRCCGRDTHLFGIIRQGRKVGIVKLGEMGKPGSLNPAREVFRDAATKIAG